MKKKPMKEPIYKSRRVWAVGLTLVSTVAIILAPDQFEIIKSIALIAASSLGLGSWVFPKK